jgi:hypothetical protein
MKKPRKKKSSKGTGKKRSRSAPATGALLMQANFLKAENATFVVTKNSYTTSSSGTPLRFKSHLISTMVRC